jgi:streptogramin lyase
VAEVKQRYVETERFTVKCDMRSSTLNKASFDEAGVAIKA